MTLLQAIVLGIVQGLTQFLPVSAVAHLRIVPALFGWRFYGGSTHPGTAFTAVVQLGTSAAIVVYFWRELLHVAVAWIRGLYDRSVRTSLEYRLGWYLILATIPIGVLGLVFRSQVSTAARNLWVIAVALVGVAVLLLGAERFGSQRRGEEQLTATDAVVVGAAQVLALVPGASRSGTMITAGLFRGLQREAAARFSFLLAIPAVVLSALYHLVDIGKHQSPGVGLTGVAVVLAFLAGLASLSWLMRWLSRHTTLIFVYYRLGLGALLIVLLSTGVLHPSS